MCEFIVCANLINKCRDSKLQGQGPQVKMLRGPVLPHGSYTPAIIIVLYDVR